MTERIQGLDGLRGIAALGVAFGFHFHYYLGIETIGWLDDKGWTLVDLFFVLSGFIFAHLYERKLPTLPTFTRARVARLYPLHLLTFFATAILLLYLPPLEATRNDSYAALLNLVGFQETGQFKSFNVPSWSISVELYCYALFFVLARLGWLRVASPIIISAALVLTLVSDTQLDHIWRGPVGFFTGCLVAIHRPKMWLVAMPAALAIFYTPPAINLGAWYSLTIWPALLVFGMKLSVLETAPFRYFGDRSYTIYLVHYPIFMMMRDMHAALIIAAVMTVSHAIYAAYELPARHFLRSSSIFRTPTSADRGVR